MRRGGAKFGEEEESWTHSFVFFLFFFSLLLFLRPPLLSSFGRISKVELKRVQVILENFEEVKRERRAILFMQIHGIFTPPLIAGLVFIFFYSFFFERMEIQHFCFSRSYQCGASLASFSLEWLRHSNWAQLPSSL